MVIWNNTRREFKQAREDIYNHNMAWITGKVILYKDRSEIVINNADLIEEVNEEAAQKQ